MGAVPQTPTRRLQGRVFETNVIGYFHLKHFDRDALDALGLRRYCCRRMLLTHADLIPKLYFSFPFPPCLF